MVYPYEERPTKCMSRKKWKWRKRPAYAKKVLELVDGQITGMLMTWLLLAGKNVDAKEIDNWLDQVNDYFYEHGFMTVTHLFDLTIGEKDWDWVERQKIFMQFPSNSKCGWAVSNCKPITIGNGL